jgi:2-dehydro-3-deoxygluconokinase
VTLRLSVAGAESNVAIQLALLGQPVAFASRVGADPFGELIRRTLEAAGVECLLDVDYERPTGVYFKDPATAATVVHYYRRGSAASTMDPGFWRRHALIGTRLIHLSGITPALSPSCAELIDVALTDRLPGARYTFDVNYRPRLWPIEEAAPRLAAYADRADIVFVGLDEAATLWGVSTAEDVRGVLPHPSTVVVKDGANGATALTQDGPVFVAAPRVDVREPVGAGDAFAAGYLHGVLLDRSEVVRLRLGHLAAGAALRTVGDIGALPSAEDLLKNATREDSW